MRAAGLNFTVQGTPSDDGYGGDFEYTHPGPLIAMDRPRERPRSVAGLASGDVAAYSFCLLMNAVATAMLALPVA